MKIKKLIKELKKYDQEAEVYLSRDNEGNSFGTVSPAFGFEKNFVTIYPEQEGIEYEELSSIASWE